ncbi:MAG: hypothetical protein DRN30_05715 [Thermoplasmata archaeon]|nr:MAG: hypothetical protein DRN30_05715 [Thermoplasmata archaeon]
MVSYRSYRWIVTRPLVDVVVLNGDRVDSAGSSGQIYIGGARHVDVMISVGTKTGSPSIQFHLDVIDEVSGATIRTYDGNTLSDAGTDYITVDGLTLGTAVQVRWDGTLDGSNYFDGVYCRVVAKR